MSKIKIYGANENNLKNIDLEIPKNKLVVFTGLSGSGKSTLAFDTLYAEGQRRYIESLSSYARQFLDRIGKPDVERIEGLTPAIAIDQKTTSKNPRSTVGTITEIYDYLRLLFARVGIQHCHRCKKPISKMSAEDIINEILKRSKHLEDLINREFIFDAVTKVSMMIGTNLSIFNKLKRHTVALVLHIQPSTLSRVLNKLKKDNIIDIICGKVSIVNMNDLKAIYEEYLDEKN